MAALAWRCQSLGLRTYRPAISSFGRRGINSGAAVRDLADLVAELPGLKTYPGIVLAGHSAGAAVAAEMSGRLASLGIRIAGLIFIDGVDNRAAMVRHMVEDGAVPSWPRVLLVDAEPSRCNRRGALSRMLLERVPAVGGWRVHGAGHGDVERWVPGGPGVPAGPGLAARTRPALAYRLACGDESRIDVAATVQALAAAGAAALAVAGIRCEAWRGEELRAVRLSALRDLGVGAKAFDNPVTTLLPGSARGR
jgi:pimeloyl-ACP methyl ester carboxylesterase